MLEQTVLFPVVLVARLLGHPEDVPEAVTKPMTYAACVAEAKDHNAQRNGYVYWCGVEGDE